MFGILTTVKQKIPSANYVNIHLSIKEINYVRNEIQKKKTLFLDILFCRIYFQDNDFLGLYIDVTKIGINMQF